MQTEQRRWTAREGWSGASGVNKSAQLVIIFGGTSVLKEGSRLRELRGVYPQAQFLGCSTAGEIFDTQVMDDSLVSTAIRFEQTTVKGVQTTLENARQSQDVGQRLAGQLPKDGLVHVFILSDGLNVNGSELVEGLRSRLPAGVTVTGGLSGDGARFAETLVVWGDEPRKNSIAAIGLYGKHLRVGYASLGGWDPFGPERLVTQSKGNVLFELDGQSALDLYKKYLGDHANDLPASGLLFPLSVRLASGDTAVVRTILSIDEKERSLTFAGDIPRGSYARLMKANIDRLIDGAHGAARISYEAVGESSPDLALLISCVGRKLVLKQRVEEEVESVREVLGPRTVMTGFYSYGEISPFTPSGRCELHNQTMTITTLLES